MRILVVSNFYPPYTIGGYELGCFEVVEALRRRGHEVTVLTSNYGVSQFGQDGHIYRYLLTYMGRNFSKFELLKKELNNQSEFKKIVSLVKPEIIYFWNLWQVSLSLVYTAERLGVPICYYVFDHWLAECSKIDDWFYRWNVASTQPLRQLLKQTLNPLVRSLGFETRLCLPSLNQAQFASHFLKESALSAGQPVSQARVIHWGLDLNHFPYRETVSYPIRHLLFVGQLVSHKGVHTLIEALKLLGQKHNYQNLELTIVGGTVLPEYELQLKELARSSGLTNQVHFAGPVRREELPVVYQAHDIMIVPSTWDEPFGIILLEAMASGLAVVGTATGGSAEILQNEVNGLVFPRGDVAACAACLLKLLENPDLYERLRQQGRQTVEAQFCFEQTMDQIEHALQELI